MDSSQGLRTSIHLIGDSMKASEETKALAKEQGIKSWWVKSEEKLQSELTETANTGETDGNSNSSSDGGSDSVSAPQEPEKQEESIERLPTGLTAKVVLFSIKCRNSKSPYWKYRGLVGY